MIKSSLENYQCELDDCICNLESKQKLNTNKNSLHVYVIN